MLFYCIFTLPFGTLDLSCPETLQGRLLARAFARAYKHTELPIKVFSLTLFVTITRGLNLIQSGSAAGLVYHGLLRNLVNAGHRQSPTMPCVLHYNLLVVLSTTLAAMLASGQHQSDQVGYVVVGERHRFYPRAVGAPPQRQRKNCSSDHERIATTTDCPSSTSCSPSGSPIFTLRAISFK